MTDQLEKNKASSNDDRIVAAILHGAAVLPFWGIALTGILWALQREKSDLIRRSGLQALGWQGTQVAATLVGFGCYIASFFLLFGTLFAADPAALEGSAPPPGFFFPFCIIGLLFFVTAGFIIVGIWAAIQALQGNEFIYPIVGKRIAQYAERNR